MSLFISYAHDDKAIVKQWIIDNLRVGGHDVWYDDQLFAGAEWQKQLAQKIAQSDALVFCITPESVNSAWCQWELISAVELGKPVVPVMLQKVEPLPDYLARLQYVDFTGGATGDAVAHLMGGLQRIALAQLPPAPNREQLEAERPYPRKPRKKPLDKRTRTIFEKIRMSDRSIRSTYIAGMFAILAAVIAGIFGLWGGVFANNISPNVTGIPIELTPAENLRLYRDEESLTLYIPDGQTLDSDNWSLGTNLRAAQALSRFFGQGQISGPTCLRLEYQNERLNNRHEDICPHWGSDRYPVVRLNLSDVFWYNQPLNWHYQIEVYLGDTLHSVCAQNAEVCQIAPN